MTAIKQCIREALAQQWVRLTPLDLSLHIRTRVPNAARQQIRAALGQMVANGELIYSQHCGTTHIQMRGAGTLPLAEGALCTLNAHGVEIPQGVPVVRLEPGLAFGAGDHPTTCLSIEGLVWVSCRIKEENPLSRASALDIGTGSGVLVVAAVMLGFGGGLGLDVDPAACFEAKHNAARNGVQDQVRFVAGTLDTIGVAHYEVVLANLRPPTLVSLMPRVASLLKTRGYCILSGFRPEEVAAVESSFSRELEVQRVIKNRGWAALVVRRV